jgi:hypothetical protein
MLELISFTHSNTSKRQEFAAFSFVKFFLKKVKANTSSTDSLAVGRQNLRLFNSSKETP